MVHSQGEELSVNVDGGVDGGTLGSKTGGWSWSQSQ